MAIKTKLQLAENIAEALSAFKADAIQLGEFNKRMAGILGDYDAHVNGGKCIEIKEYDFICLAPNMTYGWGDTLAEAKKNCKRVYGDGWKEYRIYIVPPKSKFHDTGCITTPAGTFSPIMIDEVKIK